MQQGDFTSSYYQYHQFPPNANSVDHHPPPPTPLPAAPPFPASLPPSYASAPPFAAPSTATTASYPSSTLDYLSYPHNYPSFLHNPDHVPPSVNPSTNVTPLPQYPPETHGIYSSPPAPQQQIPTTPYHPPPYDHHQSNYPPSLHPNPTLTPSSSIYPSSFNNLGSSVHENLYDNSPKFDYGSGYFDDNFGGYGGYGHNSRPNSTFDMYGKIPERPESGRYDSGLYKDDGVYAYQGKTEPYGARGTGPKSSTWSGLFDDYGRAISFPSSEKEKPSSLKVVRAVPKAEDHSDVKSGVQKFRVKLLAESGGQTVMDVLCTVGLDGIRMLDPSTSRTLRIYPLETVTRCDKLDSSTFAFWSKTSVDIEPRRIRLQSNSYTTNTILDTVTAATVQFKEMGGRIRPPETFKAPEQTAEKKKVFSDWISKLKPVNEEKDHWMPDEAVSKCTGCGADFSAFNRRHHCRNCGDIFCDKCTQGRTPLTADDNAPPVRVCDRCMAEVTQRLSKAKDAASRPVTLQSHEDLAKKLQEEMEKNLRISSGPKSEGSGRRMREVACPTCTVHLQVQVPSSGSETIECGVCQHPFLVSAH